MIAVDFLIAEHSRSRRTDSAASRPRWAMRPRSSLRLTEWSGSGREFSWTIEKL